MHAKLSTGAKRRIAIASLCLTQVACDSNDGAPAHALEPIHTTVVSPAPTATPQPAQPPTVAPAPVPSGVRPTVTATPTPTPDTETTPAPPPPSSAAPAPPEVADDFGNSAESAHGLTLGTALGGALQYENDADVFFVALGAGERITLRFNSSSAADAEVRIDGPFDFLNTYTLHAGATQIDVDFSSTETGGYFISVRSITQQLTDYSLLLKRTDHASYAEAFRFLRMATFGPTTAEIGRVMEIGVSEWLNQQLATPSAYRADDDALLGHLQRTIELATTLEPNADWFPSSVDKPDESINGPYFNGSATNYIDEYQNSAWFELAVAAQDQLRQRMAYALSQILVVSARMDSLRQHAEAVAHYADILGRHALGNFRPLLSEVARSPAMGLYLSHQGNEKANPGRNTLPDENFARELMQLFTIGLYLVDIGGVPKRDSSGQLVPSYTQTDIEEMSRVMTGWDLRYNSRYGRTDGSYVHFMEFTPEFHDFGEKTILGATIPANLADGSDLVAALDLLFNHPNTAPFISRLLIQRLVSSNPSPDYVRRVASVFIDNGYGVRGDLAAVARAILMDAEAYAPAQTSTAAPGKVNEHLLALLAWYRAFDIQPIPGWRMWSTMADGAAIDDTYFFSGDATIGQGAFRSPSVFNFYDTDFVPQDPFYRNRSPQFALPELQQRSANNIAGLVQASNTHQDFIERRYVEEDAGSLDLFIDQTNDPGDGSGSRWNRFRNILLLDYGPVIDAFDEALDGVVDGSFTRINDDSVDANGQTPKQRAIRAAIQVAESRLLGERVLDARYRDELIQELDTGDGFNFGSTRASKEAIQVCSGAVQSVFLSARNMRLQ